MQSVFESNDYRQFVLERFNSMPKAGRGQARRLAIFLGVHTTLISQVLTGRKSFTVEQASSAAEFLGLNDEEIDFFLLLVQLDRAGNESLRRNLKRQIKKLREQSRNLANRLTAETRLAEEHRAIFYSDWLYSAVRQLTAIPGFENQDTIADALSISRRKATEVIKFLVSTGLCKEERGRLSIGPKSTHLEADSRWLRLHHANWRLKAIEATGQEGESYLQYTAPLTISSRDAMRIRELIVGFLQATDQVIDPSPSEELHCLNVDWFKIIPS